MPMVRIDGLAALLASLSVINVKCFHGLCEDIGIGGCRCIGRFCLLVSMPL